MGPEYIAIGWLMIASILFVLSFVVSAVMLRSFRRALSLSLAFTGGAIAGLLAAAVLAAGFMFTLQVRFPTPANLALAVLGSVGGGIIAVLMLNKASKYPPWRRS
jgi:uncharacterized SAM-binding protein YcdF (DUF218 family)